jgi:hypothetical protein
MANQKEWYKEINKEKHKLILTDDIDSLVSCSILHNKFGVQIGGFYDFKNLYYDKDLFFMEDIFVDADTTNGKCFGNHFPINRNKQAINLTHRAEPYYKKYPFSTAILLLYLYDYDFNDFTDNQIRNLLLIDSAYKGYYSNVKKFQNIWIDWAHRINGEKLVEVVSNTPQNWWSVKSQELLTKEKVYIDSTGYLKTKLPIKTIENEIGIELIKDFDGLELEEFLSFKIQNGYKNVNHKNIFSGVYTYRDKVRYSYY